MPMTTSGKAHFRHPFTSTTQQKPARNRKHNPPLKSVQLGVQMRFTIGHTPATCSRRPEATPATPAANKCFMGMRGARARNQRPAANPRIMVPKVGMKLRVRYPPLFATNGSVRGDRLRNHWSKAFPRLVFLYQWAANPGAGDSAQPSHEPVKRAPSAVHCQRGGRNPRRNKNGSPKPICVSVSSNVKYVWGLCRERRKIPSAINRSDRHSACPNILPNAAPLARRLEIE